MRISPWICLLHIALATAVGAAETTPATQPPKCTVSVDANQKNVSEVLQSIAQQGNVKLVLESYVKGDVSISLKDKSFEDVLAAVCKSCKLDWRKIYIGKDTKILEQPDRLAAAVRMVTAMTYPDLVVSGASNNRLGLFGRDNKAIAGFDDKTASKLGLTKVYLVTNDAKVAAAVVAKDKEKEANEAVDKYLKNSKEMMESFLKMTPEQQEQAMMAGLNMMDQFPPDYAATVTRAMMSMDPQLMRDKLAKQSKSAFDAMFSMPQEQRRAFFKMQMEMSTSAMGSMTPEQQQMLQDDMKAIQEEMAVNKL